MGPLLGPRCKLEFDHKPRSITIVTNLGLLGCCYLTSGLLEPSAYAQSPEQGGGCRRLPNFLDRCWFSRHQGMSAPGTAFCKNHSSRIACCLVLLASSR